MVLTRTVCLQALQRHLASCCWRQNAELDNSSQIQQGFEVPSFLLNHYCSKMEWRKGERKKASFVLMLGKCILKRGEKTGKPRKGKSLEENSCNWTAPASTGKKEY